ARWFLLGMVFVGLICLVVGGARQRLEWKSALSAVGCLSAGIGFVAIGLLELEWLERIIGFVDGIFSGLAQWFWTSWHGSLSNSELVGRRGATVIRVAIGLPVFVWGCLWDCGSWTFERETGSRGETHERRHQVSASRPRRG